MHQLKKRKFLDGNIKINTLFPKEYYKKILEDIVQEIKNNKKSISK